MQVAEEKGNNVEDLGIQTNECSMRYWKRTVTVMPIPAIHASIRKPMPRSTKNEQAELVKLHSLHTNFKRYPGSGAQILFRRAGHSETERIQRPFPVHAMNFVLAISRHKWI